MADRKACHLLVGTYAPISNGAGAKITAVRPARCKVGAARALRIAARTLRNSKSALGAFYRRLRGRIGPAKALTATARKLAVIFYKMVTEGKAYTDLGEDYYLKQQQQRHLNRLKKQAKLFGFDLVPDHNITQPGLS